MANINQDAIFNVSGNTARIIDEERTRVRIGTDQTTDGLLVLRDALTKDWAAFVDGEQIGIHRVDGVFRGVLVPAGQHEVLFIYQPGWIRMALFLGGFSWLIFLALIWQGLHKN